ncbi:helix-turn-helix domain-containing protein [Nocardioides sp. C4-1]|uniref:winged helix-turn-helix transcriptional regulator n=1 Tax=Nocardioides sp. C4-1 TaxID=3151851 RepID=UPI0032639056
MTVSLQAMRVQSDGIFTRHCPARTVLDHVTSKWGVLVLAALADGTLRWGELRREVDGISEKMLAATLKTFEADGLVVRTAYPEVPPRVDYRLTPLGRDLVGAMSPLMTWVAAHAGEIVNG